MIEITIQDITALTNLGLAVALTVYFVYFVTQGIASKIDNLADKIDKLNNNIEKLIAKLEK